MCLSNASLYVSGQASVCYILHCEEVYCLSIFCVNHVSRHCHERALYCKSLFVHAERDGVAGGDAEAEDIGDASATAHIHETSSRSQLSLCVIHTSYFVFDFNFFFSLVAFTDPDDTNKQTTPTLSPWWSRTTSHQCPSRGVFLA